MHSCINKALECKNYFLQEEDNCFSFCANDSRSVMIEVRFQVNLVQQSHSCVVCRLYVRACLLHLRSSWQFNRPFFPFSLLKALCMSNPFNPPSLSFHLCSLRALWTTLCAPSRLAHSLSLYMYLATCFSVTLSVCLSLSEPCERATLSSLSIPAYCPRGLERITFLASLCQMFTAKIDRPTSLSTTSNNTFGLDLTPQFPLMLEQISLF